MHTSLSVFSCLFVIYPHSKSTYFSPPLHVSTPGLLLSLLSPCQFLFIISALAFLSWSPGWCKDLSRLIWMSLICTSIDFFLIDKWQLKIPSTYSLAISHSTWSISLRKLDWVLFLGTHGVGWRCWWADWALLWSFHGRVSFQVHSDCWLVGPTR